MVTYKQLESSIFKSLESLGIVPSQPVVSTITMNAMKVINAPGGGGTSKPAAVTSTSTPAPVISGPAKPPVPATPNTTAPAAESKLAAPIK